MEDFFYNVYAIVNEIPYGHVATYGQIASLMGHERNSRMVGKAMRYADLFGDFPCHRVVNSAGRCAPDWDEQRVLLEAEGVMFKANGNVDLKKSQWKNN